MNRSTTFAAIRTLPLLLALLIGCGGAQQTTSSAPPANGEDAPPASRERTTTPNDGAAPAAPDGAVADAPAAGFEPLTSREPTASLVDGEEIAAPGAVFTMPEEWRPEPPSSSMRLAQAEIPGPAGAAQLTVFFFGVGGGGGVESNVQRWADQVESDPSTPPTRDVFTTDAGFRVTWIETHGTLKPSMMGTGPTTPQPGSTLLGAVVEGEGGPWYFKATGPTDTLAVARDGFFGMLRSARRQ